MRPGGVRSTPSSKSRLLVLGGEENRGEGGARRPREVQDWGLRVGGPGLCRPVLGLGRILFSRGRSFLVCVRAFLVCVREV
jgi:hypothetical protein